MIKPMQQLRLPDLYRSGDCGISHDGARNLYTERRQRDALLIDSGKQLTDECKLYCIAYMKRAFLSYAHEYGALSVPT
jgi:hypothetical protein